MINCTQLLESLSLGLNKKFLLGMYILLILLFFCLNSCTLWNTTEEIIPLYISDPVKYDSDDPAIWFNSIDPSQSLIIGTDKNADGALYVYDIKGNSIAGKKVTGLNSPNNVDVEYGILFDGNMIDIAVVTERSEGRLRVYKLPDMIPVDGGTGIPVFVGETDRSCMGISLYKRPSDDTIFAIVSRKDGPSGSYLWQYKLEDDGSGIIAGTLVRSFGVFSGLKEIESIAVDDELGFIYYSDEIFGIRKYHADPDHPDTDMELALFGTDDFFGDMEGISIYYLEDRTGYIIISDQQANALNIYPREGSERDSHTHVLLKRINVQSERSDGNEVTHAQISSIYPGGLFVAMSDDRTFHYYSWQQFATAPGQELKIRY